MSRTLLQLRTKIRREMDLLDEPSVTDAEITEYLNDAIDEAEAEIHTLYEDYFLTSAALSLVQGQNEVALPANIYGNKIRAIVYRDGPKIYEVKRQTGKSIFETIAISNNYGTDEYYRYIMVHDSAAVGRKAYVFPTLRETSSNMTCWYLRQANTLTLDADVCDIPDFESFVVAYAKYLITLHKPGFGDVAALASQAEAQRQQMINTLSNMVPDDNTQIYMDRSHYVEMS